MGVYSRTSTRLFAPVPIASDRTVAAPSAARSNVHSPPPSRPTKRSPPNGAIGSVRLSGLNLEPVLFGGSGEEAADTVGLPVRGLLNLGQAGTLGPANQFQDLRAFALGARLAGFLDSGGLRGLFTAARRPHEEVGDESLVAAAVRERQRVTVAANGHPKPPVAVAIGRLLMHLLRYHLSGHRR